MRPGSLVLRNETLFNTSSLTSRRAFLFLRKRKREDGASTSFFPLMDELRRLGEVLMCSGLVLRHIRLRAGSSGSGGHVLGSPVMLNEIGPMMSARIVKEEGRASLASLGRYGGLQEIHRDPKRCSRRRPWRSKLKDKILVLVV